jgi:hypothetical protein
MPVYCITARHSPLPRKRLIIEADTPEEAVELFLEENRDAAKSRRKSGPVLSAHVARWESEGGRSTLDVEYAAPGCEIDLPPAPPTAPVAVAPPHHGRKGRWLDNGPVEERATSRRRSLREAAADRRREDVVANEVGGRPAESAGIQAEQPEAPARRRPRRQRVEEAQESGEEEALPDGLAPLN